MLSRSALLTKVHIALRASSEILRAPLLTHSHSSGKYSHQEIRTPNVRIRGTDTATRISEVKARREPEFNPL